MPGEVLDQMAAGYAPVASGHQPQFRTGFEGLPFAGSHPLAAMLAQAPLMNMMGNVGMVPMGLGHDQNAYDILRHRQFNAQQRQTMANVAWMDRENMTRTFRGVAALSGTPFGAEQRRAAGTLADTMTFAAPIMAQVAPDLLDSLGGMRGSATVMASRMMAGGRYQVDPVTGRMGMDSDTMSRLSTDMYRQFYGTKQDVAQMHGMTAGQAGGIYESLVARGMVGAAPGSVQERAQQAFVKMGPQALQAAAGRQNVVIPKEGPGKLDAESLDKLTLDPEVANKMRNFDGEKIKQAIKSYTSAISAVRDIFGDSGRPNAPMNQLIQSLEAMTMGQLSQMDPQRAGQMVRQTYNLARNTGVSVDNAMLLQQHAAAKASSLGLEPVFAMAATQGGLAFGGAYKGLGLASHRAWGAMSADQLQQADINLRVGAAGSNAANRLAVAVRLSESLGGFQAGSEAANLVGAVKGGLSSFQGAGGTRSLGDLTQADFYKILTQSRGASGQKLGVSENDVREMLGQRFDNREVIDRYNVGNTVRDMQGRHEVMPFLANRLGETLTTRLTQAGVGRGAARDSANAVARRAADRIMGMSTEDFADGGKRTDRAAEILEEELRGTEAGAALDKMKPEERTAFLKTSAARFYGRANEAVRSSGFRGLGNLQNIHRLFDKNTLEQAAQQQQRASFDSQLQEALSPVGRGTLLQRALDAVQNAKQGDDLSGMIGEALGGVRGAEVNAGLTAPLQRLSNKAEAVKALQNQIAKSPAGSPARQALEQRLTGMLKETQAEAAGVAKMAQDFGIFGAGNITARDTKAALDTGRSVAQQITDLSNMRGGFGLEVERVDLERAYQSYEGTKISPQEAAAVLIARRQANVGNIAEKELDASAKILREKNPGLTADAAREQARKNITAERTANVANLSDDQVRAEMKGGKIGSDAEARALVLARRQLTAPRANDQQVKETLTELRKSNPQATENDARVVANARQRAKRWGISDDEIDKIKDSEKVGEVAAIGLAAGRREMAQFDVSAAQIEYAEKTNLSLAGKSPEEIKEAILGERQRQKSVRFERFWASEDGARFRENVEQQLEHGQATAERLVDNPEVAKRFGTQAVDMHTQLKDIQQRRRALAFRHTGGNVARLLAHDFQVANKEEYVQIQQELLSMHGAEQAIFSQLHGTHGVQGRQFRRGSRDDALASLRLANADEAGTRGKHARWIAAGRPAGQTFTYKGQTEDYSPAEFEAAVRKEQEKQGNTEEAARIMGISDAEARRLLTSPEGDLSDDEKAKKQELQQRSRDVGTARGLTGSDEEALRKFGSRNQAIEKIAEQHGVTPTELLDTVVKGKALAGQKGVRLRTLDDAERQRRDGAAREYESAQKTSQEAAHQVRALERVRDNIDRQLGQAGLPDGQRRNLEKRKEVNAKRLTEEQAKAEAGRQAMAQIETRIEGDAKARGVSPADYLTGKGFLSTAERDRILGEAAKQGKSMDEIKEIAGRLNVAPNDLATVVKNVIEPQMKIAEEYRKRSQEGGVDALKELSGAFGMGFNQDDKKVQELAGKIGSSREGRGWVQYMTWTQRQLGEAAKGLRGGGGITGLAERWQEAMGQAKSADRDSALKQLQTDLGIDTGTAAGKKRWDKLTESLDFQKRAGLLGGKDAGKMTMEKIAEAYEKIRQTGELRPDQAPGAGPGQGAAGSMVITGRLYIDGRIGDLNAKTGGGAVGTVTPGG